MATATKQEPAKQEPAKQEPEKKTYTHRNYTEALEEISNRNNVPVSVCRKVVEGLMEMATDGLLSDREHFNLGRFGTFELRHIQAGRVRNPRAKEGEQQYYMAPERKKVRFRPGRTLEDQIKSHYNIGESVPITDDGTGANGEEEAEEE